MSFWLLSTDNWHNPYTVAVVSSLNVTDQGYGEAVITNKSKLNQQQSVSSVAYTAYNTAYTSA